MMNRACPEMQERIADYVLGALSAERAEAVKEHLDRCANCRRYAQGLRAQGDALVEFGQEIAADMGARREKVIAALRDVVPAEPHAGRVFPFIGGFARMAVAAVLVLGAGITIGRLTAPRPVDVERLRADLEASIAASLGPALREHVLFEVDQRLQNAASANDARLKVEIAELVHRDLQTFAAQFASASEALMDQRFTDLVQFIEAARLKDRQRVERAFREMELNRLRDRSQIGRGIWTLAAQTTEVPITTQN